MAAWLFYGFHDFDPLAKRLLQFAAERQATRRWFYLVPRQGQPRKLVHTIESSVLDHLPGREQIYLQWEELGTGLRAILEDVPEVAMQYSQNNAIPYISRVDAGIVELVRSSGTRVVSSADPIQYLDAVWSSTQLRQHRRAAGILTSIIQSVFEKAASEIIQRGETTEFALQEFILDRFQEEDLMTDSPPIVAVNENSGHPHYQLSKETHSKIQKGDFLLIDLWAKFRQEEAVYSDITWTGFFGDTIPTEFERMFDIVCRGRDRGIEFLRQRIASGDSIQGWEVDDRVREVIGYAGYKQFFVHRSGHNLGQEVHGNGVNFDNLETHDTRHVIPGIACTIEPGIYLEKFGIRSEINVYISRHGLEVTTPPQKEVLRLNV